MRASRTVLAAEPAVASGGMVVAQHPLGARAGLEVLARGGNAVDAAVTTAFAMGVVQPLMNGIGGGGQMIIRDPGGNFSSVDYGMVCPQGASEDMYQLSGEREPMGPATMRLSSRYTWPKVKDNANLTGHSSIAVPGTVAGLSGALDRWGTMDLRDALAPAIKLAREGFPIGHHFALSLLAGRKNFLRFEGATPIFYPNGQPLATGERLIQPDYARTLELIATGGPQAFYNGEPAQRIAEDAAAHGAVISLQDFADYEAVIGREIVSTSYRDHDIYGCAGPGAAPTLIEILNILSNFDIRLLGYGSVDSLHIIAEATKLAAVDRFTWLGDAAPEGGPVDALIDPEYAAKRAAEIGRSASSAEPGDPWGHLGKSVDDNHPAPSGLGPDNGTTHLTVVDANRGAVSLTQTLHGYSGVVTPGVGAMMNNGMGWFYPGSGTVNSVTPGGRGVHNMVPVIVEQDGQLKSALGGSGGRRIWTAVLQSIIHMIDYGMTLQEAIQTPRIHVESDAVLVDGRFDTGVIEGLKRNGHEVITATPRYDIAPFSEPNGISVTDVGFESGLSPVAKPTIALGLEKGETDIGGVDMPGLANDLMP
ncbi:MAG: gamma-glutamyltransferase [Chloroflexi bacterium]|nr:gamma-glutamyltransferase [Chloroflexota bacterium]